MRNEILQEPYCVRLSGTVVPCIIPQNKAYASTVREISSQKILRLTLCHHHHYGQGRPESRVETETL